MNNYRQNDISPQVDSIDIGYCVSTKVYNAIIATLILLIGIVLSLAIIRGNLFPFGIPIKN